MDEPYILAETFKALCRDKKLSHGAFRLWHALYHHRDHEEGLCCPGQRTISKEIGCDVHSLQDWTDELVQRRWLRFHRTGRNGKTFYVLLDSTDHEPLPLRKSD
ncbi:MAG TPA: helix-turn-helix domain-containing protein [Verrucomicrobiae bacterium]|jgi:DNA-binding MarR family transcriptional regulator|nr:helix-turn-helix domain-containing protein [Verrucomicrobiae bacterium]